MTKHKGAPKDIDQQEAGRLRASPSYAAAKTKLALEQARRVEQLRRRDANELIEFTVLKDILIKTGTAARTQLLALETRAHAAFPGPDHAKVIAWFHAEHVRVLHLLSAAVLKIRVNGGASDE